MSYILKIIFLALVVNIFFVFAVPLVSVASTTTGILDMSAENRIKVCRDNSCANPAPGIIDFKINDGQPLTIDKGKIISGKAWGGELGWVTFSPTPPDNLFIFDPMTGLLKGTAKSESSGLINFGVTGQKVIVDPITGEWNGWAWASGPYGGWIKFDCKDNSCLRMVWQDENTKSTTFPVTKSEDSFVNITFEKSKETIANFFNKTGGVISGIYNSVYSFLVNLQDSIF
jgi:hypothetical protein